MGSDLEKLLPIAEKLNLLSLLKNPIVLNLLVPLLLEPAPYILGPVVNLVKLDPLVWTGIAALLLGLQVKGIAAGGEVAPPLVQRSSFLVAWGSSWLVILASLMRTTSPTW